MSAELPYLRGFGNALTSEARPGAVPRDQNTPLEPPHGLYAEQISGTGFTVHRAMNHRVWLYRLRPCLPTGWRRIPNGRFAGDFSQGLPTPELLRLDPIPFPEVPTHFIAGIETALGTGSPESRAGLALHRYAATGDMTDTAFSSADGDLLVVPFEGALRIRTELGWLEVGVGSIGILPRGIRFQVLLPDGRSRGFVSELFTGHLQLPERGLIGANGLADERHFEAPVASFEDRSEPFTLLHKHGGMLWLTAVDHSPFDVVGWHGSYLPWRYDLMRFASFWSANVDHPDPSILTVLTCPHDTHGRSAMDFVVFRGRWDPTEHTFRPPFLHRNSAIEYNAVIRIPDNDGLYQPGTSTYTPYLSAHGLSEAAYERERARAAAGQDGPRRLSDDELWVQWESTFPMRVMPWIGP